MSKGVNMKFEVSEDELKDLTVKCCELGESMGITPDRFAIMLTMVSRYLSDSQGIEVTSKRLLDS